MRPWIDVTLVLQYLVDKGQLTLHEDVPKHGLMGFTDPAPGSEKQLQVFFVYQGAVFGAMAGDLQALQLPSAGSRIVDGAKIEALARAASLRYDMQVEPTDGMLLVMRAN